MPLMVLRMTLLAHSGADESGLLRLVEGIDEQSLAYDAFEVIFLVGDMTSDVRRHLDELTSRRPNVRVRPVANGGGIAAAVDEASGECLLYLGPMLLAMAPNLLPQAFGKLSSFATTHGCEMVVGRVDSALGQVNDLFLADEPRALNLSPSALVDPFVVVYRREFASRLGLIRDVGAAERAIEATEKIGVLGSYPCIVTADEVSSTRRGFVVVTDSAASWRDGRVVVRVHGSARDIPDGARLRFSIRRPASGDNYWLPGEETLSEDGAFSGSVEFDARTAALGDRLSEGVWQVDVGVHGHGAGWSARRPVPPTDLNPGIIDGILVVPTRLGDAFAVDVGANRASVITELLASDIVIEETVAGTLMTAMLSGLCVEGASRTPGFLWLDNLRLRAVLVVDGGQAKVTCVLSGLAGTSALSTQFGSSKPVATGLGLEISPVGHMSVVPTPRPSTAAASSEARAGVVPTNWRPGGNAPGHDRNGPVPRSLVTRLRRNVPGPLEPAVRAVAGNELARKLYRRLSGRRAARG
jgi:hypothetical protein